MLNKFVEIANILDQAGHYSQADCLDQYLLKYAEESDSSEIIEIPADEKEMLDLVLKSLQDSLTDRE